MEEDIELIREICDDLESQIMEAMRDVLDEHHMGIATNVLVNVGTSLIAKALIMVHAEIRPHIQLVAYKAVDGKVEEGTAAIESLVAISKAKAGNFTCSPPPKKD